MDLTDVPDVRGPSEEPPDFDDWEDPESLLNDRPIRERLLDVVLQVREPTKVAPIADRAECDTETARDYLSWFADIGLVREFDGRPTRYVLNESYYRWRRIERVRATLSHAEIVETLQGVLDEIQAFQERFGVEHPDDVSLLDVADADKVEETWEALSAWKTARSQAALLDAARRDEPGTGGQFGRIDA